jgi:hypothetical protein
MWHRIELGEHFAIVGAALQKRLGEFMVYTAARVKPLPEIDIFRSPPNPYDSEVLYLAPGTAEFLRPALAELELKPCEQPSDPNQLAQFFHWGTEDPFVKHFGQGPST